MSSAVNFELLTLLISGTLDAFIQIGLFCVAYFFQTDMFTDFAFASAISVMAMTSLVVNAMFFPRHLLITILVVAWGVRLSFFLMKRVHVLKKDKRFDKMRSNVIKFGAFWVIQGVVVFLLILPVMFFNSSPYVPFHSSYTDIGFIIALIGIIVEAAADEQKFAFKNSNPDDFVNTGLYAYCRHPNYLGEIMFWIGVFVYCMCGFTAWYHWLSVVSPLTIVGLLTSFSGMPTLNHVVKYGGRADYKKYVDETPALIPFTAWLSKRKQKIREL